MQFWKALWPLKTSLRGAGCGGDSCGAMQRRAPPGRTGHGTGPLVVCVRIHTGRVLLFAERGANAFPPPCLSYGLAAVRSAGRPSALPSRGLAAVGSSGRGRGRTADHSHSQVHGGGHGHCMAGRGGAQSRQRPRPAPHAAPPALSSAHLPLRPRAPRAGQGAVKSHGGAAKAGRRPIKWEIKK